jgi:hypothetical protein
MSNWESFRSYAKVSPFTTRCAIMVSKRGILPFFHEMLPLFFLNSINFQLAVVMITIKMLRGHNCVDVNVGAVKSMIDWSLVDRK